MQPWWDLKQLTDPNIFEGVCVYIYIYIYIYIYRSIVRSSYSAFPLTLEAISIGTGAGGGHMISKGSCDTEDWSNGCWKFSLVIAGISYILKYNKISYIKLWKYFTILQNFVSNNCSIGKHKRLLFTDPKRINCSACNCILNINCSNIYASYTCIIFVFHKPVLPLEPRQKNEVPLGWRHQLDQQS